MWVTLHAIYVSVIYFKTPELLSRESSREMTPGGGGEGRGEGDREKSWQSEDVFDLH